jgi:hypothetical protein
MGFPKSYHLEEKHLVVEAVVIAGFPEGIVLLDFASRWERKRRWKTPCPSSLVLTSRRP